MARLVYFGTPDVAVAPLHTLVEAGHDVALVVTRPDRKRGRGSDLLPSPVKQAAMDLDIPVTDDLHGAGEVGAELGVVVAYGRIIPEALLDVLPMVNLHFSLLPRWRGAAPVERALLEGDTETGVCLMEVAVGLDTGPIYDVTTVEIDDEITADTLRRRLVEAGCQLLRRHLAQGRAGLPTPWDQDGVPSYAEKLLSHELELDWRRDATYLRRLVRLGRAWTTFRGERLRVVTAAEPANDIDRAQVGTLDPGQLSGTEVGTGDGRNLLLIEVQPQGRRPMTADDWVRGARPVDGEYLGA